MKDIPWTPEQEQALFSATCKYKPTGIHKHFLMTNLQSHFSQHTGLNLSIPLLWKRLKVYYDLPKLDNYVNFLIIQTCSYFVKQEKHEDKILQQQEFELPMDDFESVIDEYRKSDTSTEDTLSIPAISPIKTPPNRKSKRLSNSSTPNDDASFTPAESEEGKGKRRSSPTRRSARASSSFTKKSTSSTPLTVDGSSGSIKRKRVLK